MLSLQLQDQFIRAICIEYSLSISKRDFLRILTVGDESKTVKDLTINGGTDHQVINLAIRLITLSIANFFRIHPIRGRRPRFYIVI
jgi:hypothetical protein